MPYRMAIFVNIIIVPFLPKILSLLAEIHESMCKGLNQRILNFENVTFTVSQLKVIKNYVPVYPF